MPLTTYHSKCSLFTIKWHTATREIAIAKIDTIRDSHIYYKVVTVLWTDDRIYGNQSLILVNNKHFYEQACKTQLICAAHSTRMCVNSTPIFTWLIITLLIIYAQQNVSTHKTNITVKTDYNMSRHDCLDINYTKFSQPEDEAHV